MTIRTMTISSVFTKNDSVDGLLDSMIEAQSVAGQIAWTDIHPTWAAGYVGNDADSPIVVIDIDSTDGADIATLTLWAAGPVDFEIDLPDA